MLDSNAVLIAHQRLGHYPEVVQYLAARGVTQDDIRLWRLGYGDADGLPPQLRGRLLFPILDHSGSLLAVTGRQLCCDPPKYWHTPFEKRRWLYGLWQRPCSVPILTEGMMDVIALRRVGYFALAPMGTALTAYQAALVALYSDWCLILPHNDAVYVADKWVATLRAVGVRGFVPALLYPSCAPSDADPDWLVLNEPDRLLSILRAATEAARRLVEPDPTEELMRALKNSLPAY